MENTRDITKECTQEDKVPLVSIVLALYNPNLKWLEEQLTSINRQTYTNIELFVMDDCSDSVSTEGMKDLVYKCVNRFEFEFFTKEKNEGSNKTFERLTELANGEYIAYCDQDDIWDDIKIEKLINIIKHENSILAYSDMRIIDTQSKIYSKSLKEIRPRLEYLRGENILNKLIYANCIAGCSMIVKAEIAKKAIPFNEKTVCDHWIAIFAASEGHISFIDEQLVSYRQHGENQTGILDGVSDKKTYYDNRINVAVSRIEQLKSKIDLPVSVLQFADSRKNKEIIGILKNRNLSKKDAYFDIAIMVLPEFVIKIIIDIIKWKRD